MKELAMRKFAEINERFPQYLDEAIDLIDLAMMEIEDGESEVHEWEKCISDMDEILRRKK